MYIYYLSSPFCLVLPPPLAETELLSAVRLTEAAAEVSSEAAAAAVAASLGEEGPWGTTERRSEALGEAEASLEDVRTGLDCSLRDSSFLTAWGLAAPNLLPPDEESPATCGCCGGWWWCLLAPSLLLLLLSECFAPAPPLRSLMRSRR